MGLKLPKGRLLNEISLDSILANIHLEPATQMVQDAYHRAGYYGGEFEQAHFEVNTGSGRGAIVFVQPSYARFMLYGRGPGKMPPVEAIAGWTRKYGIEISPWAVAKHIAKHGTKGNDFLSPVMPAVNAYIAAQIQKLMAQQIVQK